MNWSIGLHIGESCLEISARPTASKDSSTLRLRSFATANNSAAIITQFLHQNDIQNISNVKCLSSLPKRLIDNRVGEPVAFLTTAGFEGWLELNTPLVKNLTMGSISRLQFPIERDFVFGLEERVNAQGHIEKLLSDTDIEFLASKLELNKIKAVAVNFLNSHLNPENENRVAAHLRQKGIQVYLSSQIANKSSEISRFWATLMNAYTMPQLNDRMKNIKAAFEPHLTPSATFKLGPFTISDLLSDNTNGLSAAFSLSDHLALKFARTNPILYCGIEEFILIPPAAEEVEVWHSHYGPVAVPHRQFQDLNIQPTSKLGRGFFADICISDEKISMDPGPMIFGRGLTPTVFDLLFLIQSFQNLSGINEKISERGVQRLKEFLHAYSRNFNNSEITNHGFSSLDLLRRSIERDWQNEIGEKHLPNLILFGPLAAATQTVVGGKTFGDDFFLTNSLHLENK